jgi:hypothetical protein
MTLADAYLFRGSRSLVRLGAVLTAYGVVAFPAHRLFAGSDVLAAITSVAAAAGLLWCVSAPSAPTSAAVLAAGVLQTNVLIIATAGRSGAWLATSSVFALVGTLVGLASIARSFKVGATVQRHRLVESMVAARTAASRLDAHQAVEATRNHDARSVLFAIDASTTMLAEHLEDLDSATRASLLDNVTSAVARLRSLVDVRSTDMAEFRIDQIVRSVVRFERKAGRSVQSTIAPDLQAWGRPEDLAIVLETLMRAESLADQPLSINADLLGDVITIFVGPRDLTNDVGVVSPLDPGTELSPDASPETVDLYAITRLLNEQEGDIRAVAHRDGRISFRVCVPSARGVS